jgi:hypothetical protein
MLVGQAIRYRINIDATGTPNLERSTAGGQDDINGNSTWQIIARGVEDLQVQYENGIVTAGSAWHDTPGVTSCAVCSPATSGEYNSIVRRVRVRLSARSTAGNLTGQTTSAVGSAVRGQLVTEIAPRAAVATLGMFAGDL